MLEFISRETSTWISEHFVVDGDGQVYASYNMRSCVAQKKIVQVAGTKYAAFLLDSDGVLRESGTFALRRTSLDVNVVAIVGYSGVIYALSNEGQVWRQEYPSTTFSILPLPELVVSMFVYAESTVFFTTHSLYVYSRTLNHPITKRLNSTDVTLTVMVVRGSNIGVFLENDDVIVKGVTIMRNVVDIAACNYKLAVVDKEGKVFESNGVDNTFVFSAVIVPFPVTRVGYLGTGKMVVKDKKGKIMVL